MKAAARNCVQAWFLCAVGQNLGAAGNIFSNHPRIFLMNPNQNESWWVICPIDVIYNQISIYELIHELIELVAQDLIGLSD